VRTQLEAEIATPAGLAAARTELERRDPVAADRIEPGNRRRITRALEVIRITGRPFSSFGEGVQRYGPPVFAVMLAGVWLPRNVLSARITGRVAAMRERGLVDEVDALRTRGALSRTARQAIGYQEVLAHIEGNEPALEVALATTTARTRALARRQRMWFRRDPRITWFAASENPCTILPALLANWDK
jgi:tRNA dimethylallyltransferase